MKKKNEIQVKEDKEKEECKKEIHNEVVGTQVCNEPQ